MELDLMKLAQAQPQDNFPVPVLLFLLQEWPYGKLDEIYNILNW
jgi:hypothetical protein